MRSNMPVSASSATPTAPVENRPLTAASAGMRKSTYFTGPVWMAPPNTNRKMSRNIVDVTALTMSSCGVRTNWRTVRPAYVVAVAHTVGGCAGGWMVASIPALRLIRGLRFR